MELFARLGVGQSWLEVARDFHVTRRTLRRTMQRVNVVLRGEVRDFRRLIVVVHQRLCSIRDITTWHFRELNRERSTVESGDARCTA